jgi:hypothetical protein
MVPAVATCILVISVPVSKLPWYLTPFLAFLAWMFARGISEIARSPRLGRAGRAAAVLALIAGLAWPLARSVQAAKERWILHPLDAALRQLAAASGEPILVSPELRFGRQRELDATAYFLAESIRWRQSRARSAGAPRGECTIHLEARPLDAPRPADTESLFWSGPTPRGDLRLLLERRCTVSSGEVS